MTDLKAAILPVTAFQQNCTIVWCTATDKAAIVDPGGEAERIEAALDEHKVEPEKILLTHGHIDHAGAAASLRETLGLPIEGPEESDRFLLESLEDQGRQFGLPGTRNVLPDRWLAEGDTVSVGELVFDVYHCPGHTPGHIVFHHPPSHFALVGDVLFRGSIGRTDFPRGDHEALIRSIKTRLWPLGDETVFIPGHGPMSSFGEERRTNPFVGDAVTGA